jgi:hypothetical protein
MTTWTWDCDECWRLFLSDQDRNSEMVKNWTNSLVKRYTKSQVLYVWATTPIRGLAPCVYRCYQHYLQAHPEEVTLALLGGKGL